jgi:hypothetical protein
MFSILGLTNVSTEECCSWGDSVDVVISYPFFLLEKLDFEGMHNVLE